MYNSVKSIVNTHCTYLLIVLLIYCIPLADIASAWTKQIPSGTAVIVQIDQDVTSKEAFLGEIVNASVVSDVTIDGETVIRAGAPAHAVVESVSKSKIAGTPGKIQVAVLSITSVDGSQIPIMSSSKQVVGESQVVLAVVVAVICCLLGIFIHGKNGVITAGTQVTGYTAGTMEISA